MAGVSGNVAVEATGAAARVWRRWPAWVGYAAGIWSLAYGLLGLWWALDGVGFPFGSANDPNAALSVLRGTRAETAGPVIAALCFAGAAVAVAMSRTRVGGARRAVFLGFGWIFAAALALVIPDYRLLMAVAYAPFVLVGAPFGWPPGVSLLDAFPWPVVN